MISPCDYFTRDQFTKTLNLDNLDNHLALYLR